MEIVAPAGSMSRLEAAVKAGAGEIYLGLKGFGARRNAQNFNVAELIDAIDYAHIRGTRVFLTLNTMMMDRELTALYPNLKKLYEAGLDAVIVQDLGVFKFLKDNFPGIEIHGSTQMTVANHVEAEYLKSIGFKRVVLARELSFKEIKSIREKTNIELEVFVSGALCISYSGNCYLSSFIGGRSGNRGLCAQPCRKEYVSRDGQKSYLLSPKDQLFGKEEIKRLKDIGIESIKVEGRMKSEEYVYETVKYYREIIGGNTPKPNTSKIFNRGYSKGYFYGKGDIMNPYYAADFGYRIGKTLKTGEVLLEDSLSLGDGVAYISKDYEKLGGAYINKIYVGKERKEKAKDGNRVKIGRLPKGSAYVYKTYSKELLDVVSREMKGSEKRLPVNASLKAFVGEKPKLTMWTINLLSEIISVEASLDEVLARAEKSPVSKEKMQEKLGELGDTTFYLKELQFDGDLDVFVSFKTLKNLKRMAGEKLTKKLVNSYRRCITGEMKIMEFNNASQNSTCIAVCVSSTEQERAARDFGIQKIYRKGMDVAREGQLAEIDLNSKLAGNLYQIIENKNDKVSVDWNQNIGSSYALSQIAEIDKVDVVYLSPELDFKKLIDIKGSKVKKGLVVYGRLRAMYVEYPIVGEDGEFVNENGDKFRTVKNRLGNVEIYFDEPMNLIPVLDKIYTLSLDELRLDFTFESYKETLEVLQSLKNRSGKYTPYNFERGVY